MNYERSGLKILEPGAENRTNLNTRTEQLELRVDQALEESITVLKKEQDN